MKITKNFLRWFEHLVNACGAAKIIRLLKIAAAWEQAWASSN